LLLSDLDRVGFLWDTFLCHAFGMVGINWFDNRGGVGVEQRYKRVYSVSSIGVDAWNPRDTGYVVVEKLWVSFWLSQSDSHKGKQRNKSEHY